MTLFQNGFVFTAEFEDFDALAAASKPWDVQFSQVDGGRFSGRATLSSTLDIHIAHEVWRSGLLVTGSAPRGTTNIGLVKSAPAGVRSLGRELDVMRSAPAGGPGHEIHFMAPGPTELVTLAVEQRVFEQHVSANYGIDAHAIGRDWYIRPVNGAADCNARADALITLQSVLIHPATRSSEARHRLQQAVLHIAFDGLDIAPENDIASPATRRRVARRAEEVLRSRMDSPPSLGELCGLVEASQRTLHLAFSEAFGMAPKPYLRALRLNAARRRLRRCEGTVTEIAAELGFFHFARFSGEYRDLFGELPSETLRRARLENGIAQARRAMR